MSDERIAGMEHLLREMSIVFSNRQGSVTVGEDIYRPWLDSIDSLGVWNAAGYSITQTIAHPGEFSEALKDRQAEASALFLKIYADTMEAISKRHGEDAAILRILRPIDKASDSC